MGRYLLFSAFFLLIPWAFAQDSGVLVSSSGDRQVSDTPIISDQDSSNASGPRHRRHQDADTENASAPDPSADDIVIKATNAMMQQITANMKLTQDQINAVQPIVQENIARVRDLQLSLENGNIDAKTMNSQRQQANNEENGKLGMIFTPAQMQIWMNIQNQ